MLRDVIDIIDFLDNSLNSAEAFADFYAGRTAFRRDLTLRE